MKPNVLVCYEFPKNLYIKSKYSQFEIYVPEYTLVAYDEENEVLYYGYDELLYPMNEYIKDIEYANFQEFDLNPLHEYNNIKNNNLLKEHVNIPTLFEIDERENVVQLTESQPEKIVDVKGVKLKITRMYYE